MSGVGPLLSDSLLSDRGDVTAPTECWEAGSTVMTPSFSPDDLLHNRGLYFHVFTSSLSLFLNGYTVDP